MANCVKTKLIFVDQIYYVEYTTFKFPILSVGEIVKINIKNPTVPNVNKNGKLKDKISKNNDIKLKPIIGEFTVISKKNTYNSNGFTQYIELKSV